MEVIDETQCLKAMLRGDKKAFETLFLTYFPKVKLFIAKFLQDNNEAEDLAQDIFLRIWQNRATINEVENLNAYLYQAARNAVYQSIRHLLLQHEYEEKQHKSLFQNHNDGYSTEEALYANELELLIQATVERMPSQRKKIYGMSRQEGKSNEEIANELSINKRTVENHITQALADIRKVIKHFSIF